MNEPRPQPSVRLRLALEAVATGRTLSASEEAELAAAGWADATRDECQAELLALARADRAERRSELARELDTFEAWARVRAVELRLEAWLLGER